MPKTGDFNGNWQNIGPKFQNEQAQGIVYSIWVDPANASKILVGLQDGGFWETLNGGTSWQCISDKFLSNGSVGCESFAVNPFNKDEIYVGTNVTGDDSRNKVTWFYGQGLWHTMSGTGGTWALESSGMVDPMARRTIVKFCPHLLGTQSMVWSVDGDKIFSKVGTSGAGTWVDISPAGATGLSFRNITFTTPGKAYVSTYDAWLTNGYNNGRVYEVTYNTTTGAVGTWTIIADGSTAFNFGTIGSSSVGTYELAYAGSNKLYVVGSSTLNNMEGIHSLNSYDITTHNWTFLTAIEPNTINGGGFVNSTRWAMSIVVSPSHPDVVYYGNSEPARISKVNGAWHIDKLQAYNSPQCHADVRSILLYNSTSSATTTDVVYWGTDGGLSKSVGNTFQNLNGTNFYTTEVYDLDVSQVGSKISAANMHNGIQATTSTPTNWQNQPLGDGFDAIYDKRSSFITPTLLYHYSGPWIPFNHTTTGLTGSSIGFSQPITTLDNPRSAQFPHDFDVNSGEMYLANKNMFASTPSNYQPWTNLTNYANSQMGAGIFALNQQPIQERSRSIVVAPSNTSVMYYGNIYNSYADRILYVKTFSTQTNNYQWTNITPNEIKYQGYNLTDIVVDPKNEARVFISLGGINWSGPGAKRVLVSDDFGTTWSDMSSGLTELPVICMVYQSGSDDIIYGGTDAGVYRWDKPLNCWVKYNDGIDPAIKMPNVLVNDLEINYCKGTLLAGAFGRGIWESDLYNQGGETNVITQNTTWNSDKVIEGDIHVEFPAVLTINGNPNFSTNTSSTTIYMPKNGKIILDVGAQLQINGAHITNGCSSWLGIEVDGTPWPQVYSTSTGFGPYHAVVQLNKAIISNAQDALTNAGGNAYSNAGGII